MKTRLARIEALEQARQPDLVEVRDLAWFYGDRSAEPITMTREQLLQRSWTELWEDQA